MRIDSRHLLADADGIRLADTAFKRGVGLCDFCPRLSEGCDYFVKDQKLERCAQFAPALVFTGQALAGLEGSFSTFRSSSVWYERARAIFRGHKEIALVDGSSGDVIGMAHMTGAFRGPFHELMRQHAYSNHLCQASGISEPDSAAWLTTKIRNLAGKRYVKTPDQIGTVIYVQRST